MEKLTNVGRRRMLVSTGSVVALAGFGAAAHADTGAADPGAAAGPAAKPLPGYASWKDADSMIVHSANTIETRRRSEEHTSELQSLMRISYAVFCLKNKQQKTTTEKDSTNVHTSAS